MQANIPNKSAEQRAHLRKQKAVRRFPMQHVVSKSTHKRKG